MFGLVAMLVIMSVITLTGCTGDLEAVLSLSPLDSPEVAALQDTAEVRILRGGLDRIIDEPDAIDDIIDSLAVGQATYDAQWPTCMPALWLGFSDDAREPLAVAVFCEPTGAGVVQFTDLGSRAISRERADGIRKLVSASEP